MAPSHSNPTNERLRAILVEGRRAAGLTQAELATRLARPQSFVSKYERGERRLDVAELIEVAVALGLEPASIISELAGATDLKRTRRSP